jgi:ubiquinone/menaquinone biosynthesis C-methylase UbiE
VHYQRDIGDFDQRAEGYERGRRGAMHEAIIQRTLGLTLSFAPSPRRVLDVGCGTGRLLRELARLAPRVEDLQGVDPAPSMVAVAAEASAGDPRIQVRQGFAEQLPFDDGSFDLLVSSTSFDHWSDQLMGLQECARVLEPGGRLVLSDVLSPLLLFTLPFGHRNRARTPASAGRLLVEAGFRDVDFHPVYSSIIRAATARR